MSARPTSKWIEFAELPSSKSGKTRRFGVDQKKSKDASDPYDCVASLGVVAWYGAWRRYAFSPADGTVFESQCLRDIAAFCDWLMAERKAGRP